MFKWLFRSPLQPPLLPWDLSRPLLHWSNADAWTIGDACQGTQIWGSTGSGKSTGVLAILLRAMLSNGFGGIFFTCKPDDAEVYLKIIRAAGREKDVILFGPDHPHRYNFVGAEITSPTAPATAVGNLAAMLDTVCEVGDRNASRGGGGDDGYWIAARKQLCKNAIELLVLATGTVNIPDLYDLVISAPNSLEQTRNEEWQRTSLCFRCLAVGTAKPKTERETRDFRRLKEFFLKEWADLSSKTRGVVRSTFSAALDSLNRGIVRDLISSDEPSTFSLEDTHHGKIIIVDMPVLVHNEVGQFLQVALKFCYQRIQARRNTAVNPRPTFMVADESQLLTANADASFQAIARSSRTCTIYATQSISNYLAAYGGDRAEPQVYSLLGNLQLQVFCQQTDIKTNAYAAELFGKTKVMLMSGGNSRPQSAWMDLFGPEEGQVNAGFSESVDYELQPAVFSALGKGGPPRWEVETLIFQGGTRFYSTGKTYMPVTFQQQR